MLKNVQQTATEQTASERTNEPNCWKPIYQHSTLARGINLQVDNIVIYYPPDRQSTAENGEWKRQQLFVSLSSKFISLPTAATIILAGLGQLLILLALRLAIIVYNVTIVVAFIAQCLFVCS